MTIENVGYRPADNLKRWRWIEAEIDRDQIASPCCLEIGSNYGFMSLNLAKARPLGRVFSLEGSFGTGNAGSSDKKDANAIVATPGIQKHLQIRNRLGLTNNFVCVGLADAQTFKRIIRRNIAFDYLISFSVFHWVVDASGKSNPR
jgi:hypothetical protein